MMYSKIRECLAVAFLTILISPAFAAQIIDINSADAASIAENLNGIGSKKAQAIVAYRQLHGEFLNAEELIKVKGIGSKLVERNKALISYGKSVSDVLKSTETPKGDSAAKVNPLTPQPSL